MKKRKLTIALALTLLLLITLVLLDYGNYLGKRPFKNLKADSIEFATVFAIPPNKTATISDREALLKLAEILNRVTIYQQYDFGREYDGQLVRFTLHMKDGTILEIGAYNPSLVINLTYYKTKYKPCQELNAFGNKFIKK